jgi:hypothetical protein
LGSIELPLTAEAVPRQVTIMVKFLLMDRTLEYNAIVRRTSLNQLRAITSTPHLKMKFPTESEVEEVRGDQWVALQCHNMTLKDVPEKSSLGAGCKQEKQL